MNEDMQWQPHAFIARYAERCDRKGNASITLTGNLHTDRDDAYTMIGVRHSTDGHLFRKPA
jgi:hypothetical protein